MLVGRDRELLELGGALSRIASGTGALYLLSGEPGIGKTRLATELTAAARARQIRSVWGRCWEAGGAPVFWPWREAIEALGGTFPDAAAIAASDPAEARFALLREIGAELARHAAREPLVIVLEDLHAADNSTLSVLELVAGQLHALPVVVVGTYRDLEASLRAEVADTLARIGRAGRVLQLARLHAREVAALVHDAIEDADDRLAAAVYEATQGNPLFVAEIVRDLRARGGGDIAIPLGVREIIRRRLGLVAGDVRGVLEAGAVLGVEFGAAEVARMVDGAPALLDDARRSGLVVERSHRIRFAHALYREALYHDLARAERVRLHRAAAHALAATGAPLAERAHHLLESGADAAADAIDHAVRAAEHAVDCFAFEDALQLLERARAAIPPGPLEPALRGRVLIAIGDARIRSGDAGGRELCLEAARIARELGDPALLARAGLAYGAVFVMGAVDPTLVGMLDEALATLPAEPSPLRARTMARLAAARQPSPPSERARDIALGLAAIAMAREVADRRDLLAVLHAACGALYGAAHPSVRLPIARELEHLAEDLGDTARLLHARVRMAVDYLEMGDLASYAALASTYEQLARRVGRVAAPWRVPLMRSMCALAVGDLAASERWQAASVQIEPEHPRARRAQAFHRICFLRAAERHAELRARVPELRNLWLGMPYGVVLAEPRVASVLARIGADAEARAILDRVTDTMFAEQINCVPLGETIWLVGDREHAEKVYPVVAELGERWMMYWIDVECIESPLGRIRAYLDGLLGRWADADRHFEHALAAVETVGMTAMAARMRFEYGDLLARSDRAHARARALVSEARAAAEALQLVELVALIDRRHPAQRAAPAPRVERTFAMVLEGEYFAVSAGGATLRFKATRGMRYLARLVEQPGVELHVLDLAGASEADRGDAGERVDRQALGAYRARLDELRAIVEDAEAVGNAARAEAARGEMEAIAREISRASGPGGRVRRAESAVDRARSAVQRRIKDALDRVAEQDAALGRWLRRSVHTGNYCSFRPND